MSKASARQLQYIVNKISECRANRDFTDFKVICDGVDFNVHRVILGSQSPLFRAACNGNFKEAVTKSYHIEDESSKVVRKMLDHLYTGDYSESLDESPASDSPTRLPLLISALQLHARLFALGDEYCLPELCHVAAAKYVSRVENNIDPREFLDSIPDVFYSPFCQNTGLRKLVVGLFRDYFESYLQDSLIREKYDSIAAQVPDYVKKVLDEHIDAPLLGECENCGHQKPMIPLQARCRGCGRGKGISERRNMILAKDWTISF